MDNPAVWLRTVCAKGGLRVSDDQLEALRNYVGLLLEWNAKVNLISRKDIENVWKGHVLHSLSALFRVRLPASSRVLDLGTGGGLPGIPIKIAVPTISLLMIDSTRKKIDAVADMINRLGLRDTAVRWGRAEELAKEKDLHRRFDVVLVRGVGPLEELVRLAHPFVIHRSASTGRSMEMVGPITIDFPCLLAYKGGELEDEIQRAERRKTARTIQVLPLAAEGLDPAEDKKLVIVQF